MTKAASPTPARAALTAAVAAVRERAAERAKTEAALSEATERLQQSWSEVAEIERAIKDRPRTSAEDMLARGGRSLPQHLRVQLEDEILIAEPESTRDLRARLVLAEETAADWKQTRDELRIRLERFDAYDPTTQRASQAAAEVIRAEAGDVIAQTVAAAKAAMLTLIKARVTLGWLQTHYVFGNLDRDVPQPVREVLGPRQDEQDRQFRAAQASSAWRGVIDGLIADPNMPLPGAEVA